jgi:hypothetical protein
MLLSENEKRKKQKKKKKKAGDFMVLREWKWQQMNGKQMGWLVTFVAGKNNS